MKKFTIDAKGKKLGRVASEVASILMGKNRTDFAKNVVPDVEVVVTNAGQLDITQKKQDEKEYRHYSGYPGGLRFQKLSDALKKKGIGEVVRHTVSGMLPKNKLRKIMIKNLSVTE